MKGREFSGWIWSQWNVIYQDSLSLLWYFAATSFVICVVRHFRIFIYAISRQKIYCRHIYDKRFRTAELFHINRLNDVFSFCCIPSSNIMRRCGRRIWRARGVLREGLQELSPRKFPRSYRLDYTIQPQISNLKPSENKHIELRVIRF